MKVNPNGTVTILFIRKCRNYTAGDLAGFLPEDAKGMVDAKFARFPTEEELSDAAASKPTIDKDGNVARQPNLFRSEPNKNRPGRPRKTEEV